MARNINLNSSEWCDIIFEGKNKAYGAYEMRQTSSKRHLIALGIVLIFTVLVASIPSFIKAVTPDKELLGSNGGPYNIADIPLPEKEEEVIVEPTVAPPPPPIAPSIQFTPPSIVDDDKVNAENEMKTQDELRETDVRIAQQTVISDDVNGVDIDDIINEQRKVVPTAKDPDPVDFVEVMPQYPGGQAELMRYLSSSLRYPTIAAENGIEGRVVLKFVVDKTGKISNIKVIKPLDPSCDKEAVRVVQSMSTWIPGRQNGNAVAVYFTLPIQFKLQK